MEHFAWPLAALAFGIVFLFMFRNAINGFVSRVKSVGKDGVSASSLNDQKALENQTDASSTKEIESLLKYFDSPALLNRETEILTELKARKLDDSSDTTKVLVRYLAKSQLAVTCEVIYRHIFGTQILFLKRLNTVSALTHADAEEYYATVVQQYPAVFPPDESSKYFFF